MLNAFTSVGTFGFYAGMNALAFVMIWLWMPETKQRTLEELDYIFAVPTRTHMSFQIKQAAPYWFKKWVLFRKNIGPEPQLYKFEDAEGPGEENRSSEEEMSYSKEQAA